MLILSRKVGERVRIGSNIEIVVTKVQGDRVRLGFIAPDDLPIHRKEVFDRIENEQAIEFARHRTDYPATCFADSI